MARLQPDQLEEHRAWLSQWRHPDAVQMYVDQVNVWMGATDFFTQPGINFLREMHTMSRFALAQSYSQVRLSPIEPPDAQAMASGVILDFEITEADLDGRRRGWEYQQAEALTAPFETLIEDDPYEDWIADMTAIPGALRRVVEGKCRKAYGPETRLLIELNIPSRSLPRDPITEGFADSTSAARGILHSVFVLWGAEVYGPYK